MVRSMTGYGRAREMRGGRDITVEVRSVNNRYLDCTVKMPRAYIFAEDAIKTRVQKAVSRGKVDVFVTIDATGADETVVSVNEALARGYYEALTRLKESFGLEGSITPDMLAKFPDVLTVTKAEEDVDAIAADICAVLDSALASYNEMRAVEGAKLAEDVGSRADTIEETVGRVEQRSPETVAAYRQRLETKMMEVLQSATIDESRILTEAAIFADKVAVDEETVRLQPHGPAAYHAGRGYPGRPEAGLSGAGDQPRVQHHRLQVQRPDHRAGRGEHEGRGGEDPRADPEHRVRAEPCSLSISASAA